MFGFIILFLVASVGCSGCAGTQIDSRYISNQHSIERLHDSVVALVVPTGDEMNELELDHNSAHTVNTIGREHTPFCAGFFVSPRKVLTAAHCVQRYRVVQTIFGDIRIPLNEEPLGDVKKVATYSNYIGGRDRILVYKVFEVSFYNRTQDLALLTLTEGQTSPAHFSVLTIGADPRAGEQVYTIGHPAGQPWSLTEGIVSRSFRRFESGQRYTQTSSQVFFGNSGGPLINNRGEAIGVSSGLITPHMAFFTHVRSIRSFLNGR